MGGGGRQHEARNSPDIIPSLCSKSRAVNGEAVSPFFIHEMQKLLIGRLAQRTHRGVQSPFEDVELTEHHQTCKKKKCR